MRKRLSQILIIVSYFLFPIPLHAWTGDDISSGEPVATLSSLEGLFGTVLSVVLRLVGLGTLIMILVGGFKYLTSGGDPKNTEAAQQTITYGIIGLVLAISAWFIINAISSFTGNPDILNFTVGI